MKTSVLKNNYVHATVLVCLTFIFHILLLLTSSVFQHSNSLIVIFIILFYFHLIPLFYAIKKYKFKEYKWACLLLIIVSIFFLRLMFISILINMILPAVIFKLMFKDFSIKTYNKTFYAIITYTLSITIILILLLQTDYINKQAHQELNQRDQEWSTLIQKLKKDNIPEKDIIALHKAKDSFVSLIKNYYPVLTFFSFSIFLIMNLFFSILLIIRKMSEKISIINLFYIKTPEYYIWFFLVSCLLVFISFYYKNQLFRIITVNLALISTFIYIVEGGLIFLYKLLLMRINFIIKFIIIFIILQFAFMYIKYSALILAGIGILDYWFDFRKASLLSESDNKKIDKK